MAIRDHTAGVILVLTKKLSFQIFRTPTYSVALFFARPLSSRRRGGGISVRRKYRDGQWWLTEGGGGVK